MSKQGVPKGSASWSSPARLSVVSSMLGKERTPTLHPMSPFKPPLADTSLTAWRCRTKTEGLLLSCTGDGILQKWQQAYAEAATEAARFDDGARERLATDVEWRYFVVV